MLVHTVKLKAQISGKLVTSGIGDNSLVPRPSYHGVPVRGPGNNSLRMRLTRKNGASELIA